MGKVVPWSLCKQAAMIILNFRFFFIYGSYFHYNDVFDGAQEFGGLHYALNTFLMAGSLSMTRFCF